MANYNCGRCPSLFIRPNHVTCEASQNKRLAQRVYATGRDRSRVNPTIQGYRNSKWMAVNGMVERLCKEDDVGYVDMWDSFVGNEELYFRDGLHLSGKGDAVLAEGLSGAVASGLGKVRYLN